MPYLGLKVKGRNKGKTKLLSPCRHNRMTRAINRCQDTTRQEYTEVKQHLLSYGEPDLCNDYVLKDPEYIDRFCVNFPCHCVLDQVDSDTSLLDNVVLRKEAVQSTKK